MKKNRIEALVIGCGNIGALYDLKCKEILTHSKAFSQNSEFNLTIYDVNSKKSELVSKLYNCKKISSLKYIENFDVVSICTPTETHFSLLKELIKLKISLIICEKPISNNYEELNILKNYYEKNNTKILVNYFRRFHPSYILLKKKINLIEKKDKLVNVIVRYQKGFLNNCSHAIDLLEFILDKHISFGKFKITNINYDNFKNDPTVSLIGEFSNVYFNFIGISNVNYSFFEVDFYFEKSSINIKDSGNEIIFNKSQYNKLFFLPLIEEKDIKIKNAINNRMKYVIAESKDIYNNNKEDNFLASLDLNKRMLSILKKSKNGKISN